ncbi:hypothetical protein [Xanthobacter sp. KR7-225]|uniref:hypothetical protein n=1 Tax=Xanthobacter sp. KR7-225 TaxID=3156613 RepID=UPI0032B5120B
MVRAGRLIACVVVPATLAGMMPVFAQPPGAELAQKAAIADLHHVVDLTPPVPFRPYMKHPPEGAHPVAPDEVADTLMRRGFTDVSVVRQRGGAYICEATGPRGERVRLVVDAMSGDISGMQVIGYQGR